MDRFFLSLVQNRAPSVSVTIPSHRWLNLKLSDCKIVVNSLRVVSSNFSISQQITLPPQQGKHSSSIHATDYDKCRAMFIRPFLSPPPSDSHAGKLIQLLWYFAVSLGIRFTWNLTVKIPPEMLLPIHLTPEIGRVKCTELYHTC